MLLQSICYYIQAARYHKPENCHIDTTVKDYLLLRLSDQAAGKESFMPKVRERERERE